ncbi:hypothetical protein EOD39_21135 [Acipenser ruthenus]|uniref:Uncharacterized protein n=1 Tax=Acipenser ruthenus TaxID=7906 RepID=A0A444UTJ1_ACIRT|nr:hypothetical protein EOD39_21135 [Acipenser ruthenus]
MELRTEPGTPLGAVQLRELMEDVLDLFIKGSSTAREFALRFRVPAAAAAVVVVAGVFCIFLSESSSGLGLGWLPAGRALGSVVTVPAEVVARHRLRLRYCLKSSLPVGAVAALLELGDGLVMPVTVELGAVAVLELRSRLAMAEGVGPKLEVVVGVNEATDWEEGVDLEGS